MPCYDGQTPIKESDEIYSYTFSDWSPKIVPAYIDAVYFSQFESSYLYGFNYEVKTDEYGQKYIEIIAPANDVVNYPTSVAIPPLINMMVRNSC